MYFPSRMKLKLFQSRTSFIGANTSDISRSFDKFSTIPKVRRKGFPIRVSYKINNTETPNGLLSVYYRRAWNIDFAQQFKIK